MRQAANGKHGSLALTEPSSPEHGTQQGGLVSLAYP